MITLKTMEAEYHLCKMSALVSKQWWHSKWQTASSLPTPPEEGYPCSIPVPPGRKRQKPHGIQNTQIPEEVHFWSLVLRGAQVLTLSGDSYLAVFTQEHCLIEVHFLVKLPADLAFASLGCLLRGSRMPCLVAFSLLSFSCWVMTRNWGQVADSWHWTQMFLRWILWACPS